MMKYRLLGPLEVTAITHCRWVGASIADLVRARNPAARSLLGEACSPEPVESPRRAVYVGNGWLSTDGARRPLQWLRDTGLRPHTYSRRQGKPRVARSAQQHRHRIRWRPWSRRVHVPRPYWQRRERQATDRQPAESYAAQPPLRRPGKEQ